MVVVLSLFVLEVLPEVALLLLTVPLVSLLELVTLLLVASPEVTLPLPGL